MRGHGGLHGGGGEHGEEVVGHTHRNSEAPRIRQTFIPKKFAPMKDPGLLAPLPGVDDLERSGLR